MSSTDLPERRVRPSERVLPAQVFCPFCGGGNPIEGKFCVWCAKPLPHPSTYLPPVEVQSDAQHYSPRIRSVPAPTPTRKRSNYTPLIVLGTILVCVLVLALGAYYRKVPVISQGSTTTSEDVDLSSLLSGLNDNPPVYIKQISALKEGSKAFAIYFILADANGVMTTANGSVRLRITQGSIRGSEVELYDRNFSVKKSEFVKTKIGLGSFERDAILCSFGRIPYSAFSRNPTEFSGKVYVTFTTTAGRVLEGDDTVIFDR